ncbi:hypothetical protein ACIHCQ_23585 [Streptomyces sp. NPDC052236]|uniref:hypothetical protein n=1 Tax=Streptomyces sp. NPDC052236 TaxID=3365686 RepID=UPI0037D60B79
MGADPGGLLAPATPPSANAARSAGEEPVRPRPDVSSGGTATVPAQPAATSGTTEGEAEAGAATGAAASRQQQPAAAAGAGASSRAQASAAGAAAPDARAAAAAAASAGEASGDGAARGEGEPPSGNPKKPLLAAAGIAGVVLLAVPLLIWATDDSEKKKDTVSAAANSDTMLNDEPLNAPPGDYAPAKPTAQPTTAKPSAEAKAKAKAAPASSAPTVVPPPPPAPPAQNKAEAPVVKSTPAKEETYKPPPNTASLAVMQLATQNPGRHICYRAYVKDIGWQRAVCDGGTAGTTGQNRPIQALNIAVSGTNGTAATAWTQAQGYKKDWTSARDGGDLYLGNATKGAPNLGGFAINVGSKVICQNAHLNIRGWGGLKCDNPGGENFIFGGSLENAYWLEAVRFTV